MWCNFIQKYWELGHISQISTAITESKSGKTDVGGNKPIRGRIFIITPSLLDFFRNSQYPEKWSLSLRISSRNENISGVVTCQYPRIYKIGSLRKLQFCA